MSEKNNKSNGKPLNLSNSPVQVGASDQQQNEKEQERKKRHEAFNKELMELQQKYGVTLVIQYTKMPEAGLFLKDVDQASS